MRRKIFNLILMMICFVLFLFICSCRTSDNNHKHDFSSKWSSDAKSHWHECSCGEKSEESQHTYGEWIVVKEATEAEKGSKKQVCSVCSYENIVEVPTLGHIHDYSTDWSKDATNHWHECSCGEKSNKSAHSYGGWIIVKEATEAEKGSKKQVCSVCSYENIVEVPTLGHIHDYSTDWENDATNHWHECSCGEKESLAAHTYGEWIVILEPTESSVGSKKQVCSACGYENTVEIPALEHVHDYSTDWENDTTNHWHECNCGEKESVAAHTYGEWIVILEPTESSVGRKKQVCSVCGYENTVEIPALEHVHDYSTDWSKDATNHWHECSCGEKTEQSSHTYGEWIVVIEPTESSVGSKKQVCSVCGYENTVEIPALEHVHNYSTDWSKDAKNHWHECSCEEKVDLNEHMYDDWAIVNEATEDTSGLKQRSCSVCGYAEEQVVDKLPHVHKYADTYSNDVNYHWYASTCGHTNEVSGKEEHIFSENDICNICGRSKYSLDKLVFYLVNDGYEVHRNTNVSIGSEIVIPPTYNGKPVVAIKEYAFWNCHELKSIIIPDSVIRIGDYAFYYCGNLASISIPKAVTYIGDYAFYYCESLRVIKIPQNVNHIGKYAFYCCNNLYKADFRTYNVKLSIGDYAFMNCKKMQHVFFELGLVSIGAYCFKNCTELWHIQLCGGTKSQWDSIKKGSQWNYNLRWNAHVECKDGRFYFYK